MLLPFLAAADAKTRIRVHMTALAAGEYLINVAQMAVLAFFGLATWDAVTGIFVASAGINLLLLATIRLGLSKRFADPSMTGVQVASACGVNLLGILLAPRIAYLFIFSNFIVLAFGSMQLSRRAFFVTWLLLVAALWLTLGYAGGDAGEWLKNPLDRTLFCLVLSLALARSLSINAMVSRLRQRLHHKNKELAAATLKYADLASRDELTGIWNRREFMQRLDEHICRSERTGTPFCVAIFDADLFKSINDRFGHLAGDMTLATLARVLDDSRRTTDYLARYGGEEFTLLLEGVDDASVRPVLERLRVAVEQHDWHVVHPGLKMTVSIGAACWQAGETSAQLINRADQALYEVKAAGRNGIVVASCPLAKLQASLLP